MRLITISAFIYPFCASAQNLRGFQSPPHLSVSRALARNDVWSTLPAIVSNPPKDAVPTSNTDLWGFTVSTSMMSSSSSADDLWSALETTPNDTNEVDSVIHLLKQQSTSDDEVSATGCSDKYWSCPYYKGFCWHSWFKQNCPQTCNQCSGVSPAMDDTLAQLQSVDYSAGKLVRDFHPVFDFEDDGCLPDAAISREGEVNPGVGGISLTAGCRSSNFMNEANTYHRWAAKVQGLSEYQVHMYDLYFEKDRTKLRFIGGHRHEVETVLMYFKDGEPTHVAVSAHGNYDRILPWHLVPKAYDSATRAFHPKVVYNSDLLYSLPVNTHAFRFARSNEKAENPAGAFVMPPLATWDFMAGEGAWNNQKMKATANAIDTFSMKVTDTQFLKQVNNPRKPDGYPIFG